MTKRKTGPLARRGSKPRQPGNVKLSKLTKRMAGGPPAHNEAVNTAIASKRRTRALELFTGQRLTLQQVADRLASEGIQTTAKTVCLDINKALEEQNRQRLDTVEHYQAVEGARLDQLDQRLLLIVFGDLPPGSVRWVGKGKNRRLIETPIDGADQVKLRLSALSELRRNSESRRKLFGWDAQQERETGFSNDQFVAAWRAVLGGLMEAITDTAIRRTILDVVGNVSQQMRSSGRALPVIDAETSKDA